MKKLIRIYVGIVLLMVAILFGFNFIEKRQSIQKQGQIRIDMNRMVDVLQKELENGWTVESLYQQSGASVYPKDVLFYPLQASDDGLQLALAEKRKSRKAYDQSYPYGIYDGEGKLIGMAEFVYSAKDAGAQGNFTVYIWGALLVLVTAGFVMIYLDYIRPFQQLEKYPEKLSKGFISTHLPESKYRNLGKFVWGMNLLADTLEENRNSLKMAEAQRQTLLTGVAHGVKTPVANIKLYAEAIETGLYQADGVANPEDAKVAEKIKTNAEEIEKLVKQFLENSSQGISGFHMECKPFYIQEIGEQIREEFSNRFVVSHIPYEISCERNLIMKSDADAILYILAQFIENAIKYGDGTGIVVLTEVQEDSVYFSVRNKGQLLPKEELSSVCKSFWRGSNAQKVAGSGMGMYMAQEMARHLHGHVYLKRIEENSETYGQMEFTLILPLE